jgi:hypothetical protein
MRTYFVAEHETRLVFEAPSREALLVASKRVGLHAGRVTVSIEEDGR